MGKEHSFYDYIDADGSGDNVIKSWLNGEGKDAKSGFILMIGYLEGSPPGGMTGSVWKPPYVIPLKGEWKGFIELRKKVNKIQYRLIGEKKDRSVFLVTSGLHAGQGWLAGIPPGTAKIRADQMITNSVKYRRDHEL